MNKKKLEKAINLVGGIMSASKEIPSTMCCFVPMGDDQFYFARSDFQSFYIETHVKDDSLKLRKDEWFTFNPIALSSWVKTLADDDAEIKFSDSRMTVKQGNAKMDFKYVNSGKIGADEFVFGQPEMGKSITKIKVKANDLIEAFDLINIHNDDRAFLVVKAKTDHLEIAGGTPYTMGIYRIPCENNQNESSIVIPVESKKRILWFLTNFKDKDICVDFRQNHLMLSCSDNLPETSRIIITSDFNNTPEYESIFARNGDITIKVDKAKFDLLIKLLMIGANESGVIRFMYAKDKIIIAESRNDVVHIQSKFEDFVVCNGDSNQSLKAVINGRFLRNISHKAADEVLISFNDNQEDENSKKAPIIKTISKTDGFPVFETITAQVFEV